MAPPAPPAIMGPPHCTCISFSKEPVEEQPRGRPAQLQQQLIIYRVIMGWRKSVINTMRRSFASVLICIQSIYKTIKSKKSVPVDCDRWKLWVGSHPIINLIVFHTKEGCEQGERRGEEGKDEKGRIG